MPVLVVASCGPLVVLAVAGSSLARSSRAVMMPGVVSLMVAKNVACFMGGFHRIWMSKAANSSAWSRSGAAVFGPGGLGGVPGGPVNDGGVRRYR